MIMINETWKVIIDFENYEISNLGRLRKGVKIIKPIICTNGYLEYCLWKKGKRHIVLAHRLVGLYFLDNPNNLPEINHKDENKTNNCVSNLEWCTSKYNSNYGSRNKKCREVNRRNFKSVSKYTTDNVLVDVFETIEDASKSVNGDSSFISRVCKGKGLTAYGYIWKFTNND